MFKQDKEFIKQYLITALWSSTSDDGSPLDGKFDITDIDFNSIKRVVKDCLSFINKAESLDLLDGLDYSTVGHDFWLTRNGHGAGFWDGGYETLIGERLTELSNEFNEVNCIDYIVNDNLNLIEIY